MKELTIEDKAKLYDEAIERAKSKIKNDKDHVLYENDIIDIFPVLKESEDERIRKSAIEFVKQNKSFNYYFGISKEDVIAWLEKQGNKDEEILILKDQIESLHAAIKAIKETHRIELEKQGTPQVRTGIEWVNTIDDACDERYSEEYAHGEYCHEQSFKWGFQEGVDWFEKQGEQKFIDNLTQQEAMDIAVAKCFEQGEQKPADKVEPKFKVGDWVVNTVGNTNKVVKVWDDGYTLDDSAFLADSWATEHYHLWTIQDAKPGDVLFTSSTASHETFIFKSIDKKGNAKCYFAYDSEDGFREGKYHFIGSATNCKPATKEQRDLLFQKMHEAGYEWDAEKKELKKEKVDNLHNYLYGEQNSAWSEEDELQMQGIIDLLPGLTTRHNWLKSIKDRVQPQSEWSEKDVVMLDSAIAFVEHSPFTTIGKGKGDVVSWLKSLKDRYTWKPSEEEMVALEHAINCYSSISPTNTNEVFILEIMKERLKNLTK